MTTPSSRRVGCAYCPRPARFEVTDSEWEHKTLCCGSHLTRTVRFFHDVLELAALVSAAPRGGSDA